MQYRDIQKILGIKHKPLLSHICKNFPTSSLTVPSRTSLIDVLKTSDRPSKVLKNLRTLYDHGRIGKTGYLSILPVDQAIEHSVGGAFARNPIYFDPEHIIKLAIDGGCSAVASTYGALALHSKKYAHKIPFIVKLNHNELLSYPNVHDQTMYATAKQAFDMGALGVGATVYFGSHESRRQMQEVREAFAEAHKLGMFTVLWCYVRNKAFVKGKNDYQEAADITGQANHLGVTLGADIIKQKLPTLRGGFKAVGTEESPYGKTDDLVDTKLTTTNPIDLARYQVASCYMGKIPLLSSGGPSGENDLRNAVLAAVINKRAGGAGLIMGRKVFQKPRDEGLELLRAVQDVYVCEQVTIA